MTITYVDAIDAMFARFNAIWLADTTSIIGYVPELRWQGREKSTKPDMSKYWARVSQQTVLERQTTLSDNVGSPGKKRFTTSGLLFVQLFAPRDDASGMLNGRRLAVVARDAFRGHTASGEVWFRNSRINELDPEELAYRFNVVAEYEYDELG